MGTEGRDAAEDLRGATVQIRRAHFPPLDDNEFYWVDLIGYRVQNLAGETLGEVAGLIDNGAHPILRVAVPAQDAAKPQELLIPFVDRFVTTVDQQAKLMIVDWEMDY
jgi:16S rRNA processing protein RimM